MNEKCRVLDSPLKKSRSFCMQWHHVPSHTRSLRSLPNITFLYPLEDRAFAKLNLAAKKRKSVAFLPPAPERQSLQGVSFVPVGHRPCSRDSRESPSKLPPDFPVPSLLLAPVPQVLCLPHPGSALTPFVEQLQLLPTQ